MVSNMCQISCPEMGLMKPADRDTRTEMAIGLELGFETIREILFILETAFPRFIFFHMACAISPA